MFKMLNVLFLLSLFLFLPANLYGQEKPVDMQILYFIKLDGLNKNPKNYDIIINGTGHLRRSTGLYLVVDSKDKPSFIKPSYIKKVKR
tara:strand:+ start:427 stop:690 length:264 start_codon:yes stop_codon:yes gene_type:complete